MTQNSLAPKKTDDQVIKYESNGTEVKLSPKIVKDFLVNGNGTVTNQEIVMFLNLCKAQHLNPFLREAYLIKYGDQPATIVTGKEVFTKRARRNKDYSGQQAGVVVQKEDGSIESRIGTLVLSNENLVGGWAKVFISGYVEPVEITVSLSEYIGTKKNGEVNGQWSKKPATMIRKVALVQAMREAFPEDLQGMYSAEEMDVQATLDETPIQEPDQDSQPLPQDTASDPFA